MIKQIAMVAMLVLVLVLVTAAVYTQSAQAIHSGGRAFAPGQEVKSDEASTANSVAPGQQAAALGGNGATYAPGQEAKQPTCASAITNQC